MKRLVFIAVALYGLVSLYAQHQVNFLFDDKGLLRLETEELAEDKIVTVNHRSDDVVWSRVVYRIVDMRFKQNYQLYYPIVEDAEYSSLMKVMLDAIANDEMPLAVYSKSENLGVPVPRESIYGSCYDPKYNALYMIGFRKGHVYRLDLNTHEVKDLGKQAEIFNFRLKILPQISVSKNANAKPR